MKAAICRKFGQPLELEDIEIAAPGHNEISVRLAACAICHSDLMAINGDWGGQLPAVYGHEESGIVEAVGEGTSDLSPGDHVVVTLIRSCGQCHYCAQGNQVVCETTFALDEKSPLEAANGKPVTQGLRTGAFAEKVVIERSQAVKIPKDIPLDSASLLACGVITGFCAVTNTAAMPAGANAVIIGTGGVGLNAVQAARLSGAARIIAIDIAKDKLKAASEFGATHTLDAGNTDLPAAVRALTSGRGADYVFVTVGAISIFDKAPGLLAPAGKMVLVGMAASGAMAQYEAVSLAHYSQSIIGSKMGSAQIARDIPMLAGLYRQGRLKLDELITRRYPLKDINQALADTAAGKALRNVIVFEGGSS